MQSLKLMLIAIVLSGCAAPLVYTKPGTGIDEFRRDNYACVQESRTNWAGGGRGVAGAALLIVAKVDAQQQANRLYKMCMTARGYDSHEQQEGEIVRQ
jgi:uncharacterized protein YceK